ncbi:unnamed protein product [Brachionus calyciflorus]|uniref:GOLD domain-containing protein n=1 Tax=Brachionus calyciflorus TaxID=104777 RepID=A0A813MPE5_9BILA|nr:unnamed protein product [Brachionus calyciflorus]
MKLKNTNFEFALVILFVHLKDLIAQSTWIKHEFKVVIEAGKKDCFYQPIELDSVFHASYQVIKGNDIIFYVADPNREILKVLQYEQSGQHQIQKTNVKGDYEICFDNSYSQFHDKLVSIYILSFHQDSLLERFRHEKELNETTQMSREISDKISINLVEIFTHQAMSRFRGSKDEFLIEANNELVFYWSIFQTFLIILCGAFQAYFIKKLFKTRTK